MIFRKISAQGRDTTQHTSAFLHTLSLLFSSLIFTRYIPAHSNVLAIRHSPAFIRHCIFYLQNSQVGRRVENSIRQGRQLVITSISAQGCSASQYSSPSLIPFRPPLLLLSRAREHPDLIYHPRNPSFTRIYPPPLSTYNISRLVAESKTPLGKVDN